MILSLFSYGVTRTHKRTHARGGTLPIPKECEIRARVNEPFL